MREYETLEQHFQRNAERVAQKHSDALVQSLRGEAPTVEQKQAAATSAFNEIREDYLKQHLETLHHNTGVAFEEHLQRMEQYNRAEARWDRRFGWAMVLGGCAITVVGVYKSNVVAVIGGIVIALVMLALLLGSAIKHKHR